MLAHFSIFSLISTVHDAYDDNVYADVAHGTVNHGAMVHGTAIHGVVDLHGRAYHSEVVHGRASHDAMVHGAEIHDDVAYDVGCGVAMNVGNDEVVEVEMVNETMNGMVHRGDGGGDHLVVALKNPIRKLIILNKAINFQIMPLKIVF